MKKNNEMRQYFLKRRSLIRGLAATTIMGWAGTPQAQLLNKPITLIVPFAAGGNLDIVARVLAPALAKQLGQSVVVQNKPGAGGVVGVTEVSRAEPDGSTLLVTTPNAITVAPKMVATQYSIASFSSVGVIASTSLLLVAKHDNPIFKDFSTFIQYARANPGKVTIANSGIGTTNHIAILQLQAETGVDLNIITYKGSGPANIDLLGGQVDLILDQLSSSLTNIKAQRVRALMVLSTKRDPLVPEVPSTKELGLSNLDISTTAGLLAPARVPQATLNFLNKALNEVLSDTHVQEQFLRVASIAQPGTALTFFNLLEKEDRQAAVLAAAGRLKLE
jgi:tripartite-type tricarboxylate transporter receptor subunit TctC